MFEGFGDLWDWQRSERGWNSCRLDEGRGPLSAIGDRLASPVVLEGRRSELSSDLFVWFSRFCSSFRVAEKVSIDLSTPLSFTGRHWPPWRYQCVPGIIPPTGKIETTLFKGSQSSTLIRR